MQAPLPNSLARTGLVFCLFSFSACDLPTATPIFETRWIFPIEENSISVDEMLPAAVTTSGEEFEVAVDPFTFSESLGNLCFACLPFDGLVVPKPLLQFSFSDDIFLCNRRGVFRIADRICHGPDHKRSRFRSDSDRVLVLPVRLR